MQHDDSGQREDNDSADAVDTGKRRLLKRGKLVLPAVATLQVSYSAWASAADLGPNRSTQDPRTRDRKFR